MIFKKLFGKWAQRKHISTGHIWQTHSKDHTWQTHIYDKAKANIIFNGEKQKAFPLRSGTRQGGLFLPFLFNRDFEVLTTAIREEKERRGLQIGKEEVKVSPFTDDTMLYVVNPKYATRKLLELINECGQVAGHKINTWKSCMYTLMTKYQKKKLRKQSHLPLYQKE